jgi:hypothetical protein
MSFGLTAEIFNNGSDDDNDNNNLLDEKYKYDFQYLSLNKKIVKFSRDKYKGRKTTKNVNININMAEFNFNSTGKKVKKLGKSIIAIVAIITIIARKILKYVNVLGVIFRIVTLIINYHF